MHDLSIFSPSLPAQTAQRRRRLQRRAATRRRAEIDELDVLIRARYPVIYVVTWEEERVEALLSKIAAARNKKLYIWTVTQGIVRSGAEPQSTKSGSGNTTDPLSALDTVMSHVEPAIYLFKDFHPFTEDVRCNVAVIRRLRDVAYQLRDTYKTIVIVAPLMRLAPELQKDVTVIDFKPPDVADFNRLLDRIIDDVKDKPQVKINLNAEGRERLVHAARGLTLKEAENVFAKTLVLDGKIDADDVSVVFSEKQQIIKKSGLLEYFASHEDISTIGGLENLKEWLVKRTMAFSERAAEFGLPSPKGVLLLGVQGCGKSLCAKAVSSLWKLPLLRFDVGRMFGSLVGSSEENMRRAIQTAESVAPAILWVDEIDKAFAGSVSGGGSDGGTASRVFGTFLTWLGDKTTPVFVIATANDISHLPPELMRKGRLDEIFFVDLPSETEREQIFRIHLEKKSRVPDGFDLPLLARHSDGFSGGAEIEQAIVSGLFDAFSENVELDTKILVSSLGETVPLSKTISEELSRLRSWAQGRARPASGTVSSGPSEVRRKIEISRESPGGFMSSCVVIAPLVIAGWPVITAAVTAAVTSMGFNLVQGAAAATMSKVDVAPRTKQRVDIDVEESEILESSARGEEIVVEKDGIRATFSRDVRGALKLCVEGETYSKSELKRIGQELLDRVTQQYVYNRVVTELKQRNMTIVDEQVSADRTVKIRVRNL